MFLFYFALWVVFNGRWTAEIAAFGVVFAALLYAFSCAFLGFSVRADLRLIRGLPRGVRYGVRLLGEIVKANFAVMRILLDPAREVRPRLVRFESGLRSEALRVALADSITLTPGTITCQLRGDEFVVHCLDASLADGLTDGPLITALREMESPAKAAEDVLPDGLADAAAAEGPKSEDLQAEDLKSEDSVADERSDDSVAEDSVEDALAAEDAAPDDPGDAAAEDAARGTEGERDA